MKNKSQGITLIALVVTIIVLIILAGVSVNIIMGENGLMNRAKEQKIIQAKAEILQELELAKGTVAIEGNGYTSLEKYLSHISNNGLNSHRVTSIDKIDELNAEILVDDKYVYTLAQNGNDVIINEVGYAEDLYPEISSFIVKEKSSNSITVELTGRRTEEYEFYIKAPNGDYKKVSEEKIDKAQVNSWSTITYTYEKLTSISEDESYKLKVIAKRGTRQVEKEIDSNIEAIVPVEGNVTIESSTEWTNDKITTTVVTELSQYTIQYQIDATSETLLDDTKWINYIEPIVSEKNEVIYIRLWDGVNAGEITSQEITKIDKDKPNSANIVLSATKVKPNQEVKATVTLSDSKSDVDITSSKWIWTDSEDNIGLDESSYSQGTFSTNPQEIPLDTTNEGTYYLHVLTVDNAGNKIETVSHVATVENGTIELEANSYTGKYDGVAHNAVTVTKIIPSDAKIEYSINDGSYSEILPTVIEAGTYTISIKASKEGYTTKTISKTVIVSKETNILELSETSGTLTYPTSGTFTVNTNKSNGTLSVISSNEAIATASISGNTVTVVPGTTAGTATITVTSEATSNYEEQIATYTVAVQNGTLSVTANDKYYTYSGASRDVSVSCTTSGTIITYSETEDGTYSSTSPKYINAGTYTIYYKVEKVGYTTVTGSVTLTISKAPQAISVSPTSATIGTNSAGTVTVSLTKGDGTIRVRSINANLSANYSNGKIYYYSNSKTGRYGIDISVTSTTNYDSYSRIIYITVQ